MAGNAECDRCGADFELGGDELCLLHAVEDPYGFAKRYRGRLLTIADARWLGVNKESPKLGLVCDDCGTEFDHDATFLRLVRTEHLRLIPRIDEPRSLEDWHRIARGLPEVQGEDEFFESLQHAVRQAYRESKIGFEGGEHWRGPATRLNEGSEATLNINEREVTFGGLIRKWRIPAETVLKAEGEGDRLALFISGQREPVEFDVDPVELTVHLSAGPQSALLTAEDLAHRLNAKAGATLSV